MWFRNDNFITVVCFSSITVLNYSNYHTESHTVFGSILYTHSHIFMFPHAYMISISIHFYWKGVANFVTLFLSTTFRRLLHPLISAFSFILILIPTSNFLNLFIRLQGSWQIQSLQELVHGHCRPAHAKNEALNVCHFPTVSTIPTVMSWALVWLSPFFYGSVWDWIWLVLMWWNVEVKRVCMTD